MFKAVEEPLHPVAELVACSIVTPSPMPLPGRDHRRSAVAADRCAERVAVVPFVGHDVVGREAFDEGLRLVQVVTLPGGQAKPHRPAFAVHRGVDLGAQAPARTADRFAADPPWAPAECWCARTMVESKSRCSKSASPLIASSTRGQTPRWHQRLNR